MQALRIANYEITNGTFPELAEEAKSGMLRTFKDQPGFLRYGLAKTGERHACRSACGRPTSRPKRRHRLLPPGCASTWRTRSSCGRADIGDLAFFEGVPTTV